MKTLQYLLPTLFLILLSCDPDAPQTQQTNTTTTDSTATTTQVEAEKREPDLRTPLYLNGLYATSTDPSTDIRNAFDRDDASIWQTMPGAGPDEGIMLYFSKETYIKSIRVEGANGENLSEITGLQIYGNGSPMEQASLEDVAELKDNFLNVYLRFSTSENIQQTERPLESDYYSQIRLERFDKAKSIGVKNIVIEGMDGEYRIVAPKMYDGNVNSTSTLKEESFAYDPSLLFDARKEFVWVEGEKGIGKGVRLSFLFKEEVTIAGLKIWNGYQRSDSHFKSNARLKTFEFGKLRELKESYSLKDEQGVQIIKLKEPITTNSFELVINDAYEGWSYKDLAIGEILFFDEADALFGIRSPNAKTNRDKIIRNVKGTIIEEVLDSRIFNAYNEEEEDQYMTRSAILRSDGTFVLYSREDDFDSSVETLADGNWQILKAEKDYAEISVFGKFLDFGVMEAYYAGKTDAELSRIFRDKITIKGSTIQGEKLVNAIEF